MSSVAAEEEKLVLSFVDAFRRGSKKELLATLKLAIARGNFVKARTTMSKAAALAGEGYSHFILQTAFGMLESGSKFRDEASNVLLEGGAMLEGGNSIGVPELGEEGVAIVSEFARRAPLKATLKLLKGWFISRPDTIPARVAVELRTTLAAEVGPGSPPVGWTAATAFLASVPWLLSEDEMADVLKRIDNDKFGKEVETLGMVLPPNLQDVLIQHRRSAQRLKLATRAATAFKANDRWPNLEFEYRQQALHGALNHSNKQAAVGLTMGEPRLHDRCCRGLLAMGEASLGMELADAWGIKLSQKEILQARVAIAAHAPKYFQQPQELRLVVADTEASIEEMRQLLLQAPQHVIGFDAEWTSKRGDSNPEPALFQISTLEVAFMVDLLSLGHSSDSLGVALEEILQNPSLTKVGFDCFADLGKLAKSFDKLKRACTGKLPGVVDLQTLEAERRMVEERLTKNQAREGVSLSSMTEKYLGLPLNKSLQLCDWTRRPLSPAQALYASLDAYVPARIFVQRFMT
mmetsp:Transcript_69333/g.151380  ORF Transcript_69333/g.151380 Transcript_69333/m.151380 type:complete len:520 (+) Transcript_69333:263-1822(+)|eukprot:CAMPEP_0206511890 /NCGR_PEP_ID=MMETSP0324_2-20121206/60533_1 /ASSEMBLY_ACC=CAM_ASM_000836 /TAXON_ID=2866 /ORGANISM="Crypthecodinium cohnii, Strain Seligo" /LENGTH=519 /DNA_ID=CAMNT_0054003703 /DNA_START=158 /DNA_END=1717 /DNA_ORIENTATION=+